MKYLFTCFALILSVFLQSAQAPFSPQAMFRLAESFRSKNETLAALNAYQSYLAMPNTNRSEQYLAHYYIGVIQQCQGDSPKEFCNRYYKAFHLEPKRAEPLYRLALHYRIAGEHRLGLMLTRFALALPKPQEQTHVEEWIYDWGLLMEYSLNAYYTGDYSESKRASDLLLAKPTLPQHVREQVTTNLQWILPKLKS